MSDLIDSLLNLPSQISGEDIIKLLSFSHQLCCLGSVETGHFTWVNRAWEKFLGIPAQEIVETPFMDFVHPDDRERTYFEISSLKKGIQVSNFENRYKAFDGSYHWLQWNCIPKSKHVICSFARDVTAFKTSQFLLEEKVQLSEKLSDNLRCLNYLANLKSSSLKKTLVEFLECGRKQVAAGNAIIVSYQNDRECKVEVGLLESLKVVEGEIYPTDNTFCRKIFKSEKTQGFYNIEHLKDKKEKASYKRYNLGSYLGCPIYVSGKLWGNFSFSDVKPRQSPYKDHDHEFMEIMAVQLGRLIEKDQELSEIKRQKEKASNQEELFHSAFLQSPDAMILMDKKKHIQQINPSFQITFGYCSKEIHNKPISCLFKNRANQRDLDHLLQSRDTIPLSEVLCCKKNGKVFHAGNISEGLKRVSRRVFGLPGTNSRPFGA